MIFKKIIKNKVPSDLEDNPAWSVIGGVAQDAINQKTLIVSYFRSCSTLCSSVIENRNNHDEVIYPILFCLRHGCELMLKFFVTDTENQLKTRFPEKVPGKNKHDLSLRILALSEDYNAIPELIDWLTEISEIDPSSTFFRFVDEGTKKQDFTHTIKSNEVFVNLNELRICAEELAQQIPRLHKKQKREPS